MLRPHRLNVFLVFLAFFASQPNWARNGNSALAFEYDDVILTDQFETRARILMTNGNVMLHAGVGRNITFRTNGNGKIFVGNTDVSQLPDVASFRQWVSKIQVLETNDVDRQTRMLSYEKSVEMLANVFGRIIEPVKNLTIDVIALKKWKVDKNLKDARRRQVLQRLNRLIGSFLNAIQLSGCTAKPCQAGGTCIPLIARKYLCICPPHATGANCETDIDECDVYDGTPAGCQNNATCTNIAGGFTCSCPHGFHGPLCQYEMSQCSRSYEICGTHGHCVDVDNPQSQVKYRCLCDWGYKPSPDASNPTCVDVDECQSNPCHAGMECINTPGSFFCSGCPPGFQMDGQRCADIDECLGDTTVCSTDPKVRCVNTIGSYTCDPCPPGYVGDGRTCTKLSPCKDANCHPMATCKADDFALGGYSCLCPLGLAGDGIGDGGCYRSNSTVCAQSECMNGATCQPVSEEAFRCMCTDGYYGKKCESRDPCATAPCSNGGKCARQPNGDFTCQCQRGFYGSTCQMVEERCGQHVTTSEGNLTFTLDRNASIICDFAFAVPAPNSVLRLTFTSFDGMSGSGAGKTNCETTVANVTLYDGPSDMSHRLATFCGTKNSIYAPLVGEPITMTTTRALVRFRGTTGKFSLEWSVKERICGYRTTVPTGTLVVPPNKQDIACEWFVTAPADMVIEVEIPPVMMHSADKFECNTNELEVFDGYTTYDSHRVGQFCSSVNDTTTLRTTGPFLSVSFISNVIAAETRTVHRGFSLRYKVVEPQRKCGGDLVNTERSLNWKGVIESPNYGSFYPPDMDCTWRINGSSGVANATQKSGDILKLYFDEFDVPSPYLPVGGRRWSMHSERWPWRVLRTRPPSYDIITQLKCNEDYLHIYSNDDLQFDACNSHRPPFTLVMPSAEATLQFHSNGANQGKGFRMRFETVCEQEFTGNGTISTWNYPDGGAAGKCTYVIKAHRTEMITVKFKTVGLRVLDMNECFYTRKSVNEYPNYVEITGGRKDDEFLNRRYVCSKFPLVEENKIVVSGLRPLTITVNSDGNPKFRGLLAEFTTTNAGCGGMFTTLRSTLTSPNYPQRYPAHMHCVYNIIVGWTRVIRLTFDAFDLETTPSKTCEFDRIELYDYFRSEEDHGRLLGRFCGAMLPPPFLVSSNQMALVFVSDRSLSGVGFSAHFDALEAKESCDQTFTAPSGNIVFNVSDVRAAKCMYHISVDENQRVVLKMNNMTLPCYDIKLVVRNGAQETSPGFSSLYGNSEVCDEHPMPVLRSFSARVLLVVSANNARRGYFNMSYEVISSGCGGRVDGLAGSLSAPQYPLKDSRPMDCEWTVAVAAGNRIRFSLSSLDDLRSNDNQGYCHAFSGNRLDVLDSAKSESKLLKRYCKSEFAPEAVESDDNEIVVRYRQQGGLTGLYGFLAHFTTVCSNVELNTRSGLIQSPGYPHHVSTDQFCQWTIRVPEGNKILVLVHRFVVDTLYPWANGRQGTCLNDYLKVDKDDMASAEVQLKTGGINVTTTINRFCSDIVAPVSIKSSKNVMRLTYSSQKRPENQFWLSWTTVGCGGDLNRPGMIYVSRNRLDPEANTFECQYTIQAPLDKKVKMLVQSFSIYARSASCEYNSEKPFYGLALFAATSNSSGAPQSVVCDSVTQAEFKSHSNVFYMLIRVNASQVSPDERGVFFRANVTFVDSDSADKLDNCGGTVALEPGQKRQIHSPGFPEAYPSGIMCNWLFQAPDGYHIEYTLNEFYSPNHDERRQSGYYYYSTLSNMNFTCRKANNNVDGALTFYPINSTRSLPIEKICEESTKAVLIPTDAVQSLVTFVGATQFLGRKSGESGKEKTGFLLTGEAKCGGELWAESSPKSFSILALKEAACNITIKKKVPGDSIIYLRLDEVRNYSPDRPAGASSETSHIKIFADSLPPVMRDLQAHLSQRRSGSKSAAKPTILEEFTAQNKFAVDVVRGNEDYEVIVTYSTNSKVCGGEVRHDSGILREPNRDGDEFDCEWTIRNSAGNIAGVDVRELTLLASPDCVRSYLELRKFNESGPLLARVCDLDQLNSTRFTEQVIWMRLRYRKMSEDDADEGVKEIVPTMRVDFWRVAGGLTSSSEINKPVEETTSLSRAAWMIKGPKAQGLKIDFEKMRLLGEDSYLAVREFSADLYTEPFPWDEYVTPQFKSATERRFNGSQVPADLYLPYNEALVIAIYEPMDDFKLIWEPISMDANATTTAPEASKQGYDCGEVLIPTYDWRSISNPLPPGEVTGYPNDVHCMWTIARPMFTGIEIKFEKLQLETENDRVCPYDFVGIVVDLNADPNTKDAEVKNAQRHCSIKQSNDSYHYSYNKFLRIHFVSDKSVSGSGFRMLYRLTCISFDIVRNANGGFEQTLTSPHWPLPSTREWDCKWTIIMESNRKLTAEVIDLDMDDVENCPNNYVILSSRTHLWAPRDLQSKYCGKLDSNEKANFTTQHGRLFVRYVAAPNSKKGFKLLVKEKTISCPGIIHVDETNPSREIFTPEYPNYLPNSLDCDYVMTAPNGHRLKFTIDPDSFASVTTHDCSFDFIEIFDGPSRHSPSMGRYLMYCKAGPSTLFSTSNYLVMRLSTQYQSRSRGFNATVELASCGGTLLVTDESEEQLITSPDFPDQYPPKSQCTWTVRSANTHLLETKVESLWLTYTANCTKDQLSVRDGNATDDFLIPPSCNGRSMTKDWIRSTGSRLTVEFNANSSVMRTSRQYCHNKKCGFELAVKLSDTRCGGRITNGTGIITVPGYPDKLVRRIKCVWTFDAEPGFRYVLVLRFRDGVVSPFRTVVARVEPGKKDYHCHPELELIDGDPERDRAMSMYSRPFCMNSTVLVTNSDVAQLVYEDKLSVDQMLAEVAYTKKSPLEPFTIKYIKIPSTPKSGGCTQLVQRNLTSTFTNLVKRNVDRVGASADFCHWVIKRPQNFETVTITVFNYSNPISHDAIKSCTDWFSFVELTVTKPLEIRQRLCNSSFDNHTTSSTASFVVDRIDLSAVFRNDVENQTFSLKIDFQQCGGVIGAPNSGVLTSPNYGPNRVYLQNSHCKWVLAAPDGQVVKIKFTNMEIEYDPSCEHDVLTVGEGLDNKLLHRYCYGNSTDDDTGPASEELADRFKTIKSRTRYMTLEWHTDDTKERAGWRLEYDFINEDSECGFSTSGMSGVVHSPNWNESDYGNDEECIWDIQVPVGYHIVAHFTHFDIETSADCEKDSLTISEELKSNAEGAIGNYEFYFEHEARGTPTCGINVPKDFESASNRIRLNFTSNGDVGAKGFRIEWRAVCGGMLQMSHGVVSSPNYPHFYGDRDQECMYLISPGIDKYVVALRFLDFNLNDLHRYFNYGRYPCEADYVEVLEFADDGVQGRSVLTVCGGTKPLETPFSVEGPVGIRFVSNSTSLYNMDPSFGERRIRGFQLTYSIEECGRDISLSDGKWTEQISSPAFPLEYEHNLDCVWNITTTPDRILAVKMLEMDIEHLADCSADKLEFFDSNSIVNTTSMAKLCGDSSKIPVGFLTSTGPNLMARFLTDFSMKSKGFKFVVTATLGENAGCGGKLVAKSTWQSLKPPVDDKGEYFPAMICGWTITGDRNTRIEMRLTEMDTEKLKQTGQDVPKPMCLDSLAIYDGVRTLSPLLAGDLCSETVGDLPAFFHSSHRHAFVYFETDDEIGGKGFNLEYRTLEADCGAWLKAKSTPQTMVYRGKPKSDALAQQKMQRCRYVVEAEENAPVLIQINTLNFESNAGDCSDSFVEVTRVCGTALPPVHISNTNLVQISTSAVIDAHQSAVLSFTYYTLNVCNRTIDGRQTMSGRLTSPYYPEPYAFNMTCLTTLLTNGKKVLFVYTAIALENIGLDEDPECTDYLNINETSVNGRKLQICPTSTLPPSTFTDGSDIKLELVTDHSVNGAGYDMSFFLLFKETDFLYHFYDTYEREGSLSSVGFPEGYKPGVRQVFTLRPPNGLRCEVRILTMSVAVTSPENCAVVDEYVDIEQSTGQDADADSEDPPTNSIRMRDCSMDSSAESPVITMDPGMDRYLKFTFKADDDRTNDGKGFKVSWKCANSDQ